MVIKQMKYFVAIVETMNYREAAERLFISQSAISQQIAALEAEFGIELLKRHGRSFSVTPAGNYFYHQCKSLLKQLEDTALETIRIGSDRENLLRVGCLNLYRGQGLRSAGIEFSRTYPEIDLSITTGNHEELYRKIMTGEVDLVLNDQRRAFSDEFENVILASATVMADIPENFPLSREDRAELGELASLPCALLSMKEGHSTDEPYFRDVLGYTGAFYPVDTFDDASIAAASNRCFLPFHGVGTIPPAPVGVKRLPLYRNKKPLRSRFCAFWLKERSGYYVEEFVNILKAHIGNVTS